MLMLDLATINVHFKYELPNFICSKIGQGHQNLTSGQSKLP